KNLETGTTGAFWSRDGKRIVFRRYAGNPDYALAHDVPVAFRTIALTGRDERPFDGNWSRYDVPWVSRDGRLALEFKLTPGGIPSDWQTKQPDDNLIVFQPRGSQLTGFSTLFVAPQSPLVALSASSPQSREREVWLSSLDGQLLRLLVRGGENQSAEILAWL
ncbi:MAG: hypothetical protein KY445_15275, partial [Armatimonadetes bacterium]|nr:hypothetical protein [Armatimonadota bacterium]